MEKISNWLDNLNNNEFSIFLILFGIFFTACFHYLHKTWKKEGYKPFKNFRRKDKTQSEDNYVIIMHMRTLLGFYVGILIILLGLFMLIKTNF